jgi:Glycosyltransferases, probably involved in cell wall biogenesis
VSQGKTLKRRLTSVEWSSLILFCSALVPFGLLIRLMQPETVFALGTLIGVITIYGGWSYLVIKFDSPYATLFSWKGLCVAFVCYGFGVVTLGWVQPSLTSGVYLFAIALIFLYYWFIALAAVYHNQRYHSQDAPPEPSASISIIVPAYNEEGYIQRTITALLDADYPDGKREIIVIDDGSTDNTCAEARAFESETVSVVTKDNGGKYSALNYGLLFASNEIILTVDADSVPEKDALKQMVAPLSDQSVGAVASTVTIWNRGSLLTGCQQLEYTIGVNVYRRMLDLFGIVMVVPGCLGAYRRDVLDEIQGFDPQTLTEDFDITVKVLRAGYEVRSSEARVYTEAPDSLRDLYNQRLRWYRGNYMTIFKHRGVLSEPTTGFLYRFAFPLRLVELLFLPFASWVILGLIVKILLSGFVIQVVSLFIFFLSIIFLIAALGVYIEGEDWRLLWYTPLFLVGYKHFHDALLLKSLADVLLGRNLSWTRATRIEQRSNQPTQSNQVESDAEVETAD